MAPRTYHGNAKGERRVMTTKEELTEQVKAVAEARDNNERLQAEKADHYERWKRDNAPLLKIAEDAAAEAQEAESKLREMTLEVYAETGDKAPVPGVGVREMERLVYPEGLAFEWATAKGLALTLDKKAFEKIARATHIPFVTKQPEATATIATDLQKVLDGESE